jgi:hypothetical protein
MDQTAVHRCWSAHCTGWCGSQSAPLMLGCELQRQNWRVRFLQSSTPEWRPPHKAAVLSAERSRRSTISRITAHHTLEDIAALADGQLDPGQARDLLYSVKQGLTPVQYACLKAALQTDRLLDLLDMERPMSDEPTQADRIEMLLGRIIERLEQQAGRIAAIECALCRRLA